MLGGGMEDELDIASQYDAPMLGRLRDDADNAMAVLTSYKDALLKEYSDPLMTRAATIREAYSGALKQRPHAAPGIFAESCGRLVKLVRAGAESGDGDPKWHRLGTAAVKAMALRRRELAEIASILGGLSETFGADLSEVGASSNTERYGLGARSYGGLEQGCLFGGWSICLLVLSRWLDRSIAIAMERDVQVHGVETVDGGIYSLTPPPALRPLGEGPSLGFRTPSSQYTGVAEAVLLERAGEAHEAALQAVRSRLSERGVECLESPLIDLAFVIGDAAAIVEVKSITIANEREQVRAAFAQLHDYRFVYRNEVPFAGRTVVMWVTLGAPPVDPWTRAFLRDAHIGLVWLSTDGALAGPDVDQLGR
jgi:hypothetical protein